MPQQDPSWSESVLPYLEYGLIALAGIWVVAELVRSAHRRAYNLTKAETTRSKAIEPSFTKVDHEARKAAIERGDAYQKAREEAEAARRAKAPEPELRNWGKVARAISKVVAGAIVALVPPAASGLTRPDGTKYAWVEGMSEIVSRNAVGIGLAVGVLAVSLFQFVTKRSKNAGLEGR